MWPGWFEERTPLPLWTGGCGTGRDVLGTGVRAGRCSSHLPPGAPPPTGPLALFIRLSSGLPSPRLGHLLSELTELPAPSSHCLAPSPSQWSFVAMVMSRLREGRRGSAHLPLWLTLCPVLACARGQLQEAAVEPCYLAGRAVAPSDHALPGVTARDHYPVLTRSMHLPPWPQGLSPLR